MRFRFRPVEFEELRTDIVSHLESLPGSADSFLEEHILASRQYRIERGQEIVGFASIHYGSLITQFSVREEFRRHGQALFTDLRAMEKVTSALVPTFDVYYLAHTLDEYQQLEKQAYLFQAPDWSMASALWDQWSQRPAGREDAELILDRSGNFFSQVIRHIEAKELFITLRDEEPVGFGIVTRSKLYPAVASIGMFTIEEHRQTGVGTATVVMLIEHCRQLGLEPVAGCWYQNHASKRTLERVGMYSPNRLLRIEF